MSDLTPAELRARPGSHYSEGRRYSHISNAWIFAEDWNDREEVAYLKAKLDIERAKREALEVEMRLAMSFIGMVPHHVFKYPHEVVAFYELNARYAPTVQP
jgi:hypothetical protein